MPGYEIDFLPVGTGKSGDAIAFRHGDESWQEVVIVDGGTRESGQALVDHIQSYYGTRRVDHLINTHPDIDHVSGLRDVINQLDVQNVWMHLPWNHSTHIHEQIIDGRVTPNSLNRRLKEQLAAAHELQQLAEALNIPVREPFQGQAIGPWTVLSPTITQYRQYLLESDKTPEAEIPIKKAGLAQIFAEAATAMTFGALEMFGLETLREPPRGTSPTNESSVVLYADLGTDRILLTGDAGIRALSDAINYAALRGVDLQSATLLQIPHHGSRQNVSPDLLDRLLGSKPLFESVPMRRHAVACVGTTDEKHPRRVVTNAFRRRGCRVAQTRGDAIWFHYNAPSRPAYGDLSEVPHYEWVEDY
jgi:beta-lactamase superfamily II metal-dependent hydrolase